MILGRAMLHCSHTSAIDKIQNFHAIAPLLALSESLKHCLLPSTKHRMNLEETFDRAVQLAGSSDGGRWPLSEDQKLTLYACYKQVTVGNCTGERPGFFNLIARKKYDAWKALENTNKEEAMRKYIEVVDSQADAGWKEDK